MITINFINEQNYKSDIGVYKIHNVVNDKVYVGQTTQGFQRRYWHHQWKLRNGTHDNKHLQNAWNKYGEENFEFIVVEITDAKHIDEREEYWIKHYRSTGRCYSIQDGGQPERLVQYVTPEHRKAIGELNRQRMTGTKLSDETKAKMSQSRRNRPHVKRSTDKISEDQARRVKEMFVNGSTSWDIQEATCIPYKIINNILSLNSWSCVLVDGWDEFQRTRLKHPGVPVNGEKRCTNKKTPEEIALIVDTYEKCQSYYRTAKLLGIGRDTATKYIKQHKQAS